MKFTIDSSELSKALERAAKFVSAKPLMPIISTIKLVAIDDRIELTAFNLAHGTEIKCNAEVIEEGNACIPTSAIAIIKLMAGQLIVESDENHLITISNLSGKVEIQGQSTEDYPELDSIDCLPDSIESKPFNQAVKYCIQACSIDESKSVLTGVNIAATAGNLRLMATDGHRLVVCNLPVSEIVEIESVTIPAKSLALIPADGGQFMQCKFDTSQVSIDSGSRSIMRTLEGKYPDAMMLVPKSFTRELTIDRRELIDALNMMSSISDQNNLVKFAVNDCAELSSSSDGKSGKIKVECTMLGSLGGYPIDIAFNLKYLLDGLKMFESKEIKISMNEPLQPVIITAIDSDLDLLYLAMPIQLKS
jgi:DNA polymerase III subunit beta